ncbi:MAG: hypothetical protein BRD50_06110 [Bacteroidetes bacterium SW_11_45_7]|nr:MAG: hypothetical protein BRD50_06110 [Bacteroidetes bacterium SW_11_45_7]
MRKLLILLIIVSVIGLLLSGGSYYAFRVFPHNALQEAETRPPLDAVIVPGYPSDSGRWSSLMKARVYWSYYLGIPSDHIFTETRAEHSTENLYYSWHLAKEQGFSTLGLASDPVQSIMLMPFANSENFDVRYLPIDFAILKDIDKTDPAIAEQRAFVDSFRSLPERQNWWKRLKGTFGQQIQR